MPRGLFRRLTLAAAALGLVARLFAAEQPTCPAVERFWALGDPDPTQYRALRHLEARNDHFNRDATMTVWTEGDAAGFRFEVIAEDGSEYIRNRVFRQTLEAERGMWASGALNRAALTPANYAFEDRGIQPDGLTSVLVKPRRKDLLLIDGAAFFSRDDGDLVRMEGRLSKTPSFWTRHVQVVRSFRRFNGIRMPVAVESTANVLVAGKSSFKMTYEYEFVNGVRVGAPQSGAVPR